MENLLRSKCKEMGDVWRDGSGNVKHLFFFTWGYVYIYIYIIIYIICHQHLNDLEFCLNEDFVGGYNGRIMVRRYDVDRV